MDSRSTGLVESDAPVKSPYICTHRSSVDAGQKEGAT